MLRNNNYVVTLVLCIVVLFFKDPGAEYVEEFSTEFVEGARELEVSLLIASTAYLSVDSTLTITISGLQLSIIEGMYYVINKQLILYVSQLLSVTIPCVCLCTQGGHYCTVFYCTVLYCTVL